MEDEPRNAPDPPAPVERPAGFAADEVTNEDVSADLFDFVDDFTDDESRGEVRELSHYLARYPRAQAAVAAEYLRLIGAEDLGPPAGSVDAPRDDPDEDRIGRYRLLRKLGAGGQGEVWLARDGGLQRDVALKLLGARFVTEDRRERFRREAESIARLEHPGVAQVFEADVDASEPYIAMRFVEGIDLGSVIAQELAAMGEAPDGPRVGSPIPVRASTRPEVIQVLRFFERAARALHAAHEAGVVHRDVKPGNIMVTGDGSPVLLDFGLARDDREADEGSSTPTLTREGDVFGTLAYMAPEQLRGETNAVDARADVWALGVTLFEVLAGERPFEGKGPAALAVAIDQGHAKSLRVLNRSVPNDAIVVTETALEPSLDRRYGTAFEFAEDLRRVCEYEPIQAASAGPWLRLRRWCRREPAWAAAIGGTAMALVLGLVASLYALGQKAEALEAKGVALEEKGVALEEKDAALARANSLLRISKLPVFEKSTSSGALALAVEAAELDESSATRSALVGAMLEVSLQAKFDFKGGRAWQVVFLEGEQAGQLAIVGAEDKVLVGSIEGRRLEQERALGVPVFECVQVPGAGPLLVGTGDGRVLVLDPGTLETLAEHVLGDGEIVDLVAPREGLAAALVGKTEVALFEPLGGAVLARHALGDHGDFGALKAATTGAGLRLLVTSYGLHGNHTTSTSSAALLIDPEVEGPPTVLVHDARIVDASIARRAAVAATIDEGGRVRCIDLAGMDWMPGSEAGPVVELGEAGASVALDDHARLLAVGARRSRNAVVPVGQPQTLRGFALREGEPAEALWDTPCGFAVGDLSFRPGSEELACAAWRTGELKVVHGRSGDLVHRHNETTLAKHLTWSEEGEWLGVLGNISAVSVWRGDGPREAHRIVWRKEGRPVELAGGAFLAGTDRIALWEASGAGVVVESPGASGGGVVSPGELVVDFGGRAQRGAGCVVVCDDAPVLFSVAPDLTVTRVDGSSGHVTHAVEGPPVSADDGLHWADCEGGGGGVWVSTTGGRLWRWGADTGWADIGRDGDDGRVVCLLPERRAVVNSVSGALVRVGIEPDGSPSAPLSFESVSLPGGKPLGLLSSLAASPDGTKVVAVDLEGHNVFVWDAETGEHLGFVSTPSFRKRVAWSALGGLIVGETGATGAGWHVVLDGEPPADGTAWGTRTRAPLVTQKAVVTAFGAAPRGPLAYFVSRDGRMQIWSVENGDVRFDVAPFAPTSAELEGGAGGEIVAAGLNVPPESEPGPGARVLAVGRRAAAVWPLEILPAAKRLAPRGLSRSELELLDQRPR